MAIEETHVHPRSLVLAGTVPSSWSAFPPDVARLLEVLARIELRRQTRLCAERAQARQEVH